jgi:hypothetical protein
MIQQPYNNLNLNKGTKKKRLARRTVNDKSPRKLLLSLSADRIAVKLFQEDEELIKL